MASRNCGKLDSGVTIYSMRAFSQLSKPKEPQSNVQVKERPHTGDTTHAYIRHLANRVRDLETEVSTLRRDLNATRRKVYRDDSPPSMETPPVVSDARADKSDHLGMLKELINA